jgi:hypothetical protein
MKSNRRAPKFQLGQVIAEIGHSWHFVKIFEIAGKSAKVLGYNGEYTVDLSKMRPLTKRERGPERRK